MEKPDSEGYVNVIWPSKNVPHGGIFHTRTAEHSTDQQQFLKVLLEESKLNLKLRQTRAFGLRGDDGELQTARARAGSGTTKAARAPAAAPPPRPRTSHRRSLSAIRSSGALDVDTYRPLKRGEDRERMKERLADTMASGDRPDQAPPAFLAMPRNKKPTPKLPTAKETWNDLVTQIRERAEWLAEMEWLGEAAPHREIVQEQIAERMRALDALGVDSACSSVRSSARSTAGSSTRQCERSAAGSAEPRAEVCSSASPKGEASKKRVKAAAGGRRRAQKPEENVTAYSQLSPLGYSPRRRV